jgi:cell division protein FtsQ
MQYRPEAEPKKARASNAPNTRRTSADAYARAATQHLPWDIRLMRITTALLVTISLVLLSVLAVQWLANRGVFSINHLQLSGDLQHVNAASVRVQAKDKVAGSYFTLDLKAAQQAFEQLPWVRLATVRRIWPHGMAVSIQAHEPVAYWTTLAESGSNAAPEERLLNSYAEVFEANSDEVDDELPRLSGAPGRAPRVWQMYAQLGEQLKLAGISNKVSALSLNTRSEWEVELEDGLSLSLGRDDDKLWQRIAQYTSTIEQARAQLAALGQRATWARVDLRHTQGYAIAMRKTAEPDINNSPSSTNEAINHVTDSKGGDTITSMSKPSNVAKSINSREASSGAATQTR